jgi:murein DD-endopeptidase MepM/ murein hydrolase activator NlpD
MPIYDYTSRPKKPESRKPRRWIFLCMLLSVGALFGLNGGSDSEENTEVPLETTAPADSVEIALILPAPPNSEPEPQSQWAEIDGRIQRGENFSEALIREGISRQQIFELVPILRKHIPRTEFNPNLVQSGDRYAITLDTLGVLHKFEYIKRGDLERRFLAERTGNKLKAWKEEIPLHREVVVISERIEDSIWNALAQTDESPLLIYKLEYIFEAYIDVDNDCYPADRFAFAIEKLYNETGDFVRYGEILGAQYTSAKNDTTYQAFLYTAADDKEDYYDAKGGSLQGLFLRKPLNFTRISSGFNQRRLHPILKKYIPHHGIDYAAPHGTTVWAIADGIVSFVGPKGALGNYVEIKHKNGYKTGYGHLSKFPRGLRQGKKVKQKQTIGYVGATGRATGPHLHFNFYATTKGKYKLVKPSADNNRPTGKPLPSEFMAEFEQKREQLLALLDRNSGTIVTAFIQNQPVAVTEE